MIQPNFESNSERENGGTAFERGTAENIVETSLEDIRRLQETVASSLGIEADSADATFATDAELVRIAEMETDFEEEDDAFNNAAVESALEVDSGVAPEQTPVAVLELDGYGGDIDGAVTRLHESHAVLPSGHEAAPILMRAVDELHGKTSVSFLQYAPEKQAARNPLETTVETARATAAEKARTGYERSEFEGYEVREAVGEYYADHEVTLRLLEDLMDATDADAESFRNAKSVEAAIKNADLKEGVEALLDAKAAGDEAAFGFVGKELLKMAYCEPAVGQLTLNETDWEHIAQEKTKLSLELEKRAGDTVDPVREYERQLNTLHGADIATRNEVRNGGQLLFHNTAYGEEVWLQGSLRGRMQQNETQDVTMTTSAETAGHSEMIHWSEVYDNFAYKQVTIAQMESDALEPQPVTYAVPMAEMIARAPYARGLEYAVVRSKIGVEARAALVGEPHAEVTGRIGHGQTDMTGNGKPSVDRVFWASTENKHAGGTYDVPVIGDETVRRNAKTGNMESVVYQIQSESDMLRAIANTNRITGQDRLRIAAMSEKEVLYEYGKRITHANAGTGYGYPQRRIIKDLPTSEVPGTGERIAQRQSWKDGDEQAVAAAIRKIEAESKERFAGQYVVPLRARENDFMFKGDNSVSRRFGAELQRELGRIRSKNTLL